jgi:hypothetical protein
MRVLHKNYNKEKNKMMDILYSGSLFFEKISIDFDFDTNKNLYLYPVFMNFNDRKIYVGDAYDLKTANHIRENLEHLVKNTSVDFGIIKLKTNYDHFNFIENFFESRNMNCLEIEKNENGTFVVFIKCFLIVEKND